MRAWNNISFSNQGFGLRSFIDIKAKGSIWMSGGYEMNYMQEFKKFGELRTMEIWQRSVLIGLTKKYKIGKKKGSIQVLVDLLDFREKSTDQILKFRMGYQF